MCADNLVPDINSLNCWHGGHMTSHPIWTWRTHDFTSYLNRILNNVGALEIRDTQHSDVTDSQGRERLIIASRSQREEMHHQNERCSLADRQCICCHSLRRHHGALEYDLCREQQTEDSNVPGTQECPSVCYYTGKAYFLILMILQLVGLCHYSFGVWRLCCLCSVYFILDKQMCLCLLFLLISQISFSFLIPQSARLSNMSGTPAVPCHTRSQHAHWHTQDYVILQPGSPPSSLSPILSFLS